MANENSLPVRHVSYLRQAKDLSMGVHPLSKYVPPLLLLADAFLTSLIIYKVSCKFNFADLPDTALIDGICRYGN